MNTNNWTQLKLLATLVLGLVAVGCAPCSPEMAPRDVSVSLDDSLRDTAGKLKSVQVDIIAVNSSELERWKQEPLDAYWRPGGSNLPQTPGIHVMKFDAIENVPLKTLSARDAAWTNWKAKNAMDLVVVVNIPGYKGTTAGMADSRRLVLTLDRCRWADVSEPIKVQVSSAGVVSASQPKPETKK